MLTFDDVTDHLGIDYADDPVVQRKVQRAWNTAERVMLGAVGVDVRQYLPDDPRVDELVLIYADDLYSERGVSAKVSNATRMMVSTTELQLRLELAAKKEEAAAGGGS